MTKSLVTAYTKEIYSFEKCQFDIKKLTKCGIGNDKLTCYVLFIQILCSILSLKKTPLKYNSK